MRLERPEGWGRGISVGCGEGAKEISLARIGLVDHFDLYEISEVRAEKGRALAEAQGVSDKVAFHTRDAFQEDLGQYDLVYWNNALHHMLDTNDAVRWSRDRLKKGGSFVMDDYVGRNRLQWSSAEMDVAEKVRRLLPERFLRDPLNLDRELPLRPLPLSVEEWIRRDPTECADSENIIPAITSYFPEAEITYTGGVIYHLALNDVIAHFDEDEDRHLLSALLMADLAYARAGLTHYAVVIARR